MPKAPDHLLLSRTDSIGDVMLTLPLAGLLKQHYPQARITFLGRSYTAPVLRCCPHVDQVITLEELSTTGDDGAVRSLRDLQADVVVHVFPQRQVATWCRKAGIPVRIGTSHRWWHWTTCNHRVAFSRRKSDLHEAQLNVKLLAPLGITAIPDLHTLSLLDGFKAPVVDDRSRSFVRPGVRNIILHPLSKGSAVEWGLDHFATLIQQLDPARYHVIVTGTAAEAERYRKGLPLHLPHVSDAGGALDLTRLIGLIGACDALVAASTGPLHIAAACGIRAIGLYSPKRPIHPGRWAPIGPDVHAVVADDIGTEQDPLAHIRAISPEAVMRLLQW